MSSQEAEAGRSLLLSALSQLSGSVGRVVQEVREGYQACSDVDDFIRMGDGVRIGRLFAVVSSYAQCMETVGVRSRVELEKFWARHFVHPEVREAVETLLEEEDNFHQLVEEVDSRVSDIEDRLTTNPPASEGQLLPGNLELIESPSGQQTTLEESWKGSKSTLYVCIRHFG